MRTKNPVRAGKMLDAAADLFGAQHFHEVRMEDVAARAGVGKGTIYRYFEDKDELYLALLERAGIQLGERMRQAIARVDTPFEQLVAVVATVIQFFDEQPQVFDLIQRADAMRGRATPWQKTRDETIRLVRRLIEDARIRGDFFVDDVEVATLMLLGGMRAVIRFGSRPHADPLDLARRIVQAFLFGAAQRRN